MNQKGGSLILVMQFLSVISLLGLGVSKGIMNDQNIHKNLALSKEALYNAEAGIEQAREFLRNINQKSPQPDSFSDDLSVLNKSKKEENKYGTKLEIPLRGDKNDFDLYLKEDKNEKANPFFSGNRKVILTSVGKTRQNQTMTIKSQLSLFQQFPALPGTITILGPEAHYIGNENPNKIISGNDYCGEEVSKPVFALTEKTSYLKIKAVIEENNPETYSTRHLLGAVQNIKSDGRLNTLSRDFGINFQDPRELKKLSKNIEALADTILKENVENKTVNLGNSKNPQIVVSEKDFLLNRDGAGILLVKGSLGIEESITYEGIILVIGKGVIIFGKGYQTLKGGLLAANIETSEKGKEELGKVLIDTSMADNLLITACSRAINTTLSNLPLTVTAYTLLEDDQVI